MSALYWFWCCTHGMVASLLLHLSCDPFLLPDFDAMCCFCTDVADLQADGQSHLNNSIVNRNCSENINLISRGKMAPLARWAC